MHEHVLAEKRLGWIFFLAYVALEFAQRAIGVINFHVYIKIGLIAKAFAAQLAHIRSFARVQATMSYKNMLEFKLFAAVFAFKRTFFSVGRRR
jgi:hypothetical protein